jgi:hypothetical protein
VSIPEILSLLQVGLAAIALWCDSMQDEEFKNAPLWHPVYGTHFSALVKQPAPAQQSLKRRETVRVQLNRGYTYKYLDEEVAPD